VVRVLGRVLRQADAEGRPLLHALEDEVDTVGIALRHAAQPRQHVVLLAYPLVSANCERVGERAVVPTNRPSLDLSPWPPEEEPAEKRGTDLASSISPNSCMGVRARTSKEGNGVCHKERALSASMSRRGKST